MIDKVEVIVGFEKRTKQELAGDYITPVTEFLKFEKNYSVYPYSSNINSSNENPKGLISIIEILGAVGFYIFFKSEDFFKVKDKDLIAAMNYAIYYLCPNYTVIGSAVLGSPDAVAGKAILFISPFNNQNIQLDFDKDLIENVNLHFSESELTKRLRSVESISDMKASDYYEFIAMYQVVITSLITFYLVDMGYDLYIEPAPSFSVILKSNGVSETVSVDIQQVRNSFLGLK